LLVSTISTVADLKLPKPKLVITRGSRSPGTPKPLMPALEHAQLSTGNLEIQPELARASTTFGDAVPSTSAPEPAEEGVRDIPP